MVCTFLLCSLKLRLNNLQQIGHFRSIVFILLLCKLIRAICPLRDGPRGGIDGGPADFRKSGPKISVPNFYTFSSFISIGWQGAKPHRYYLSGAEIHRRPLDYLWYLRPFELPTIGPVGSVINATAIKLQRGRLPACRGHSPWRRNHSSRS